MAYGTVKVDNITFTNGGIDQTVTVSGIVQSISGDITATGTIQGATIIGTSTVSGATVTGDAGVFTTVTGGSAGFTTVTGTTVTGTTANFATLSGTTITGSVGNFGSGSAAAPSVSVGTTDNGIYSPGTDQVAISTNGTGRLFVDASGDVGVGGSASNYSDHKSLFLFGAANNGAGFLQFNDTSNNADAAIFADDGSLFINADYDNTSSNSSIRFRVDGSSEKMRITSDGKLGLGTSSPSTRLHVNSSDASATYLRVENTAGYALFGVDSSGNAYAGAETNDAFGLVTNGSYRMYITAGGNVGVGTTSPGSPLTIESNAGNQVKITYPSIASYYLNATSGGDFAINKDGSERLRITSDGKVGLGTSSPQAIIHSTPSAVNGGLSTAFIATQGGTGTNTGTALRFGYNSTDGAFSEIAGAYENPGTYLDLKTSTDNSTAASTKLRITAAGNVGVGTTAPGAALEVIGTSGTISARSSTGVSAPALQIYNDGTNSFIDSTAYGAGSGGAIVFRRNGSGEMGRWDTSGRLGLGTSSPGTSKLYVLGDATNYGITTEAPSGYGSLGLKQTGGNSISLGMISNSLFVYDNTAGATRITLDSSGNVGVGTTSPGTSLHIQGANTIGKGQLIVSSASAGQEARMTFVDGSDDIAEISTNGNDFYLLNETATGGFQWYTGGSERLRITSDGKLGLGTSSPVATNHIRGSGTSGQVTASWMLENSSSGTVGMDVTGAAGSSIWRFLYGGGPLTGTNALTPALTIGVEGSAAGRVGVGTTGPAGQLSCTSDFVFGNQAGTGSSGTGRILATGGEVYIQGGLAASSGSAAPIVFTNYGGVGERARLDASGRLLVGTTSSSGPEFLAIQGQTGNSAAGAGISIKRGELPTSITSGSGIGNIYFEASDGSRFATIICQADANAGSGDYPGRLVFSTTADGASSPTERMRIANDGKLTVPGVYDFTTADAANVRVIGGGEIVRSSSSLKYKTDVETLEDSYADAVLNCRPVWFRSLSAVDNPSWGYWGFIAEEVAEIDPRLVSWKTTETTYDENGRAVQTPCDPEPEGVQYDRFVPHLLSLIKRQQQAIETLEAKVAALETP